MSYSDPYDKKGSFNIINNEEENRQVKDEINKQINGIYTNIPKLLGKISEYIKGKNEISEESKFIGFAGELRDINQKISDLFSDIKISFQIGEKKYNSSFLDDCEQKQYEENKIFYDNFYKSFDNEKKNLREEYIKSFLNSVKFIFEEFIFLLNLKNDNILPYFSGNENISESHIDFLNKINKVFGTFTNVKSINRNNDESENFLSRSNITDIENMSMGSSSSDFRINIIESVEQYVNYKENGISIDFIKFNAKNLNDLFFLKDSKLIYLKRLELRTNYIKDIFPLQDCSCGNLINLNISHNQLNNDSVEILLNMKLDKLEKLILFDNKITTIKILKLGEKFKNLKKFHIGKNLLNEKEIIENKDKFNLSQTIENIGMSNNFNECFSNQKNIDIKFFNYITFENIKLLYLNRNDLFLLKVFENNNFNRLEMVWLTYNNISDIEEIRYFHNEKNKKTLKDFLLNGNKISSISDNFIKLLEKFELNTINISLNPINLENFKDKIEKIEKKGIRLLNL